MNIPQAIQLALQQLQSGQPAQAETLLRQVLQHDSRNAFATHWLGIIAHQAGRNDESLELMNQSIALEPANAEFHSNLAHLHFRLGQLDAAVAAARKSIALNPKHAPAHFNLGLALNDLNQADPSAAEFRTAAQLQPQNADAWNNLGFVLMKLEQFGEALECFNEAISLRPGFADALSNAALVYRARGEIEQAIAACQRALSIRPDSRIHSMLLLTLHYRHHDPQAVFAEHRRFGGLYARVPGSGFRVPECAPRDPEPGTRNPTAPLRIGYVSPFFKQHANVFFAESFLRHHDRSRFEIFCYADVTNPDSTTQRLQSFGHHWRDISRLSDDQACELIRQDQIDILVDLAGHDGGRMLLFARKPAPIQITYLGYPDTTGLPTMDYRITDAIADPPGMTEHLHTEKLLRLPESFLCYTPAPDVPLIPSPGTPGEGQGEGSEPVALKSQSPTLVFGCFNILAKITPDMIAAWSRILSAIPGSRLVLKSPGLRDPSLQDRIRRLFATPDRIEFLGQVPSFSEHLARYNRIDIALDTYPYTGTNTTADALYMGVPVVTLAGQTHVSRVGASFLTTLGLPNLIAQDIDDYVRIAVELASDRPALAALKSGLRERMRKSSLGDAARFTRNLESAYRKVWSV